MEQVECVVIGAGVVGLACARALAQAGREVIVLERAGAFGTETSARNSEVIHAGLYYVPGSLKARFCVEGKGLLYDYCARSGVGAKRMGKLVVAVDGTQIEALKAIQANAEACGVHDLQWLSADEAHELEPNVRCSAALLSPSTGLVDSHGLMLSYLGDAENAGAMLALNSPVIGGRVRGDGVELDVGGEAPMTLRARMVVNCAGLWAPDIARKIEGIPASTIPELLYARGVYFTLVGKQPFSMPIYPIPRADSLGCHYTIDLGGQGKFGPDVEMIDEIDYTVDPARGDAFYDAVRQYWPDLPDGALQPGYAGVRPQLPPNGGPKVDFNIQGADVHGVAGMVNLYGMESPGLTGSLAIARHVERLLA